MTTNHVVLVGHIHQSIDLRQTPEGHFVTSWRLTVPKRHRSDPLIMRCVAWNDLAKWAHEHISQDHPIRIEGYLDDRVYTSKRDHQDHHVYEIVVQRVDIVADWDHLDQILGGYALGGTSAVHRQSVSAPA